ncbi:MAG TPA: amidohydrolase family protein [Candidatus Dormibacteraeota bacterium]|nr:amidohydrolase family protein [Candidatus Dormibacteraeota bacterium]
MVSSHRVQILDGARFYRFDARSARFVRHDAMIVDEGKIRSLDARDAGTGVPRVDLRGATVLPAFADCHVHLTDVGYFLGPRDLATTTDYASFERAVAKIPRDGGMVYAGQYDESHWLDGASADARPLERLHADARAMLVRIDGHSCLVNRATLQWLALPSHVEGLERDERAEPTGRLTLAANWLAQSRFLNAIAVEQRREAERRAVDLALSRGALHLHAQLCGFAREQYAREIDALRRLPAKIVPKICEPDPALAVELGLPFVGGDVFADGSIGSRTAALTQPYADAPTCGALQFRDDELAAFFADAERLGVAAGVHAIGDAAIDQCVAAWERVLSGKPSARGARHFIEHFECARPEHIEACARMKLHLSMQPLFDAQWGGAGGMYEGRLGTARMRRMNALASIVRAGAVLCGGDDAPVCPLDPLAGMRACVEHHEATERLTPHDALAAYTVNAARLAYAETQTGNLEPGLAADLVVLDHDPFEDGFERCTVLETWSDGAVVYRA